VAAGSGTTVSQNRLVEALQLAGARAELVYPSRFATTPEGLAERGRVNASLEPTGFDAVLGIDGEGWLWAAKTRTTPYIAFCEAVLVEVLPFEGPAVAAILRQQADWEGAAARAADHVVARSEFAARRVAEAYDVPQERITSLPIPFDIDAWRGALPALAKEPLVLAVGHLYPRKNYRTLLEAWPAVQAAIPEARLAIVGTGPEPLDGEHLLGHVPYQELLALYARASVFCHPSLQENFGIAVVEGLASGASVVVHQQPAVLENVAGVPGAEAVDATNRETLAEAIIRGLRAPAPWPASRLDRLKQKLDPLRIGQRLLSLTNP
jgi:glycosyltransferase involved in cell wall biosynthesis